MAGFFDWLGDALGLNKGKGTIDAANQNRELVTQYGQQAGGILDAGLGEARGFLDQINGLTSLGPGANDIYRSALGLADPSIAQSAFRASPGYQFSVDQSLDALDRRAASRGMLDSGNTNLDTIDYVTGRADQEFGNWLTNLTGGIDRNLRSLGDLATFTEGGTDRRLGLAGDVTSGLLAANNQAGAGREAGQGSLLDLVGTIVGIGGKVAGGGLGLPMGVGGVGAGFKMPAFGGYGR